MEVVWGHDTGVLEDVVLDFDGNWTGTGTIENPGDADIERIALDDGESMTSNLVHTGAASVLIDYNVYEDGDTIYLEYRHADTPAGVAGAGWQEYLAPFESLGYVQVRVSHT